MNLMNLFTRRQLEIIKFASKEKDRPKINGLRFEPGLTVATDGSLLICVRAEQIQGEVWPANAIPWCKVEKPFTIGRQAVERALMSMPSKAEISVLKKIAVGRIEDGGKAILQSTDLEITVNTETILDDQDFPEYEKVIPDYSKFFKLKMSAKYLKEVCSALEKYQDSGCVTLHIDTSKENRPLMVTAEDYDGNRAEVMIMPFRGNE